MWSGRGLFFGETAWASTPARILQNPTFGEHVRGRTGTAHGSALRGADGDRLLESEDVGDNIIAILAGLRDHKEAVHRIMERIAGLAAAERETALAQLMILAGLRHLSQIVERETRNMPIDLDIRDHEVLGPMFIEAEQKGRQEGELTVLRRQIEKRFGPLPGWAGEKLAALPASALEELSERVLDAKSVEELLP